jgi:DNA polymerase-3 subunit delta
MKLQAAAADSFLKAPDKKFRAALIYGPDEGQVRERAQSLARRIVEDPADPFRIAELTPEQVAGDPTALVDEANALSLMGGRRLIMLRSAGDKATAACTALAEDETQSDSFVIVEAGDLGPRSPLRKLFEGNARLAALACYVDDEKTLARLIRETLHAEKIAADHDAVAYLSSALQGDRALTRRALEKLILYLDADGKTARVLSVDDAIAAVGDASGRELDDPARAAADGDRAGAAGALTRLFEEGDSPVAILRVAQSYFRRLHLARAAYERGDSLEGAVSALRPPVFFKQVPQIKAQVQAWRLASLAQALDRLIECEAEVKKTGAPDALLTSRAFILIAQLAKSGK